MTMSPFTKRLAMIIAALNLFVVAVTAMWLEHSLGQYRRDARLVVDNLAHVLQASLTGTMRHIDLALLTVADEYRRQSAAGGIDERLLNGLMARQQGHLPEIESLRATDRSGAVRFGIGANPRTNLSDREFVIAARDNANPGLVVAKPVFARISRKWVVVLARRLEAADGSFAGVVYINFALDRLSRDFLAIDIGPGGTASLRGADLGLFVRVPQTEPTDAAIGSKALAPELEQLLREGKSAGHYISRTAGVERASAFRRLDPYPLIVTIGIAEEDYLSVWRQEVVVASAMVALFALVTLSSAWLLVRAWRRQEATAAELASSKEELERRVGERTAQLEVANRELEEFSYSVSHDMRTPLRAINGYSTILLEEHQDRLDEEGQRLLRALARNAGQMGRLIDDILRFLGMGRRKLKAAPVDVGALAREVFAEMRDANPERSMRLEAAPMPAAWADSDMVKQMLGELFSNAVKFSPPEREALIEVSGKEEGPDVVYRVKDHGAGFDMRYAGKLFRVFERVHATGQFGGTGIGLAIVKRIVDMHGGRVWAEGSVGSGATFHFALPRPHAAAPADSRASAEAN